MLRTRTSVAQDQGSPGSQGSQGARGSAGSQGSHGSRTNPENLENPSNPENLENRPNLENPANRANPANPDPYPRSVSAEHLAESHRSRSTSATRRRRTTGRPHDGSRPRDIAA